MRMGTPDKGSRSAPSARRAAGTPPGRSGAAAPPPPDSAEASGAMAGIAVQPPFPDPPRTEGRRPASRRPPSRPSARAPPMRTRGAAARRRHLASEAQDPPAPVDGARAGCPAASWTYGSGGGPGAPRSHPASRREAGRAPIWLDALPYQTIVRISPAAASPNSPLRLPRRDSSTTD